MSASTQALSSLDSSRQSGISSTSNTQLQSSIASSGVLLSPSPTATSFSSLQLSTSASSASEDAAPVSPISVVPVSPTTFSVSNSIFLASSEASATNISSTSTPASPSPTTQTKDLGAPEFSAASSVSLVTSIVSIPKIASLSATTLSSPVPTVQTKDVEAPNLSVDQTVISSTTDKAASSISTQSMVSSSGISSGDIDSGRVTSIATSSRPPSPGPAPTPPAESMPAASSTAASSSPVKIIESSNAPAPAASSNSGPAPPPPPPSQSTSNDAPSTHIQTSTTTIHAASTTQQPTTQPTQPAQSTQKSAATSNKPQSSPPAAPPASSTTVSVHLIKASTTTPVGTSTVIMTPESTLSSLVVVTVTDGPDGRKSLSTPALVTLLSTSTEPNGGFVTFTHVVANPTGFSNNAQDVNRSGFIHNQGAVAGVFVVVGIVTAALAIGVYWCVRRRRRLNRRKRWLAGIRQQRPPSLYGNPFEDPQDAAPMRSVDQRDAASLNSAAPYRDEPGTPGQAGIGLSGFNNGIPSPRKPAPQVLFPEVPRQQAFGPTPLEHIHLDHSRQSTPSIYPASLPPNDDVITPISPISPTFEQNTSVQPPPRPPRSHLRDTLKRALDYAPLLTPPASISSHAGSTPDTPLSEVNTNKGSQDMLFRRTLLDVRPRSAQERS